MISYFYNTGADTFADCLEDLQTVGATEIRAEVERVSGLFPKRVSLNLSRRTRYDTLCAEVARAIDEADPVGLLVLGSPEDARRQVRRKSDELSTKSSCVGLTPDSPGPRKPTTRLPAKYGKRCSDFAPANQLPDNERFGRSLSARVDSQYSRASHMTTTGDSTLRSSTSRASSLFGRTQADKLGRPSQAEAVTVDTVIRRQAGQLAIHVLAPEGIDLQFIYRAGCGRPSLTDARANYRRIRACDQESINHVRQPKPEELL